MYFDCSATSSKFIQPLPERISMSEKRRVHSAAFKGKVALEALKELKPINVLASQYEIQPNQISTLEKAAKRGRIRNIQQKTW